MVVVDDNVPGQVAPTGASTPRNLFLANSLLRQLMVSNYLVLRYRFLRPFGSVTRRQPKHFQEMERVGAQTRPFMYDCFFGYHYL
jgi:hypothetical protein